MKRKIRDKWLKALRSGKFKQGRRRLRDADHGQHCCLGVLCELSGGEWHEFDAFGFVHSTMLHEEFALPVEVAKWAGLPVDGDRKTTKVDLVVAWDAPFWTDPRAQNFSRDGAVTLAALNDLGFSFAEIADLIETYLPVED